MLQDARGNSEIGADRTTSAARLGDYFELQLRLADHVASRLGLDMPTAVLRYTNFHRRFGFGDPDEMLAPDWQIYAGKLRSLQSTVARVDWTQEFFRTTSTEIPPANRYFFGCFRCDAPDTQGVMRIHFGNHDRDGSSPLHRSKIERRRYELGQMVAFARQRFPETLSIKGLSWLYNLEAYRRLFPPSYGRSARLAEPVRLNGSSSWGQFLKYDETIKSDLRDRFLQSFGGMDVAAPWRSFPLPPLTAQAPLADFADFYQGIHVPVRCV